MGAAFFVNSKLGYILRDVAFIVFLINWRNLRFRHTFVGSPEGRPPQPTKVRS